MTTFIRIGNVGIICFVVVESGIPATSFPSHVGLVEVENL
jgi:hypothetical protein